MGGWGVLGGLAGKGGRVYRHLPRCEHFVAKRAESEVGIYQYLSGKLPLVYDILNIGPWFGLVFHCLVTK